MLPWIGLSLNPKKPNPKGKGAPQSRILSHPILQAQPWMLQRPFPHLEDPSHNSQCGKARKFQIFPGKNHKKPQETESGAALRIPFLGKRVGNSSSSQGREDPGFLWKIAPFARENPDIQQKFQPGIPAPCQAREMLFHPKKTPTGNGGAFKNSRIFPASSLPQLDLLSPEPNPCWKIPVFRLFFLYPFLLSPSPAIPDANLWKSGGARSQPGIIKDGKKFHCSMEKGRLIFPVKN